MKISLKLLGICVVNVLLVVSAFGQPVLSESGIPTESGVPVIERETPRDDVYDRHLMEEKRLLTYDHLREADVFWEKRIWRVVDVREKMNKPFVYPQKPFINILLDLGSTSMSFLLFSLLVFVVLVIAA